MNKLSNDIYTYYVNNWQNLAFDKQFHFASRLHLWSGDNDMRSRLAGMYNRYTLDDNPRAAVAKIIQDVDNAAYYGSKNAAELRRPYFEKFPRLKRYTAVLYYVHFLRTIYSVDSRPLIFEHFTMEELAQCREELLQDNQALSILSTQAVNFLFLHEHLINDDASPIPLEPFMHIDRSHYDFTDNVQVQLFIYLYTHCIIGDSHFYDRHIPHSRLSDYQSMMTRLEELIGRRYVDINLDNKFEFLVCAKLTNYKTSLEERIFFEAAHSLSYDGIFIVDRHNHNRQAENISIDKSEHRNVLYIMASRPKHLER